MPGFLLHVGAGAICPHGAPVQVISTNSRVLVSGQPVATLNDMYLIAGCAFNVASKPQPCIKIQWITPASRVMINGSPVILQNSIGICQSPEQAPQGPPIVVSIQTRVKGT